MTASSQTLAMAGEFNVYLRREDPARPWFVAIEHDGERVQLAGLAALVALLERLAQDGTPPVRGLR